MSVKDRGFFQSFGTFFAVGYHDARTSGAKDASVNYSDRQALAYDLGFKEGIKDKMTSTLRRLT